MSWTQKIAIVGSREGIDRNAVEEFINHLDSDHNIVISGGAKGVDSWAAERAEARGIETLVIRPNWKKHGNGAGFRRNKLIVHEADSVVAFWDGESRGTEHTIKTAIEAGKHTAVFSASGVLLREFIPDAS